MKCNAVKHLSLEGNCAHHMVESALAVGRDENTFIGKQVHIAHLPTPVVLLPAPVFGFEQTVVQLTLDLFARNHIPLSLKLFSYESLVLWNAALLPYNTIGIRDNVETSILVALNCKEPFIYG